MQLILMLALLLEHTMYGVPVYLVPANRQIIVDYEKDVYVGQPDMIMLNDNKTLLTVYPLGHGLGECILKKSVDGGKTWSDRKRPSATWKDSMETPTIYKLNFANGSMTKLIEISGGPGWGAGFRGITTSISNDLGETWSDYKAWFNGQETIVALSSLIYLKENGRFIDKWMGTFHNNSFINQKVYLTFDEKGNEYWTQPVPMLGQWRDIESKVYMCEINLFRSPDGSAIGLLARSYTHKHKSTFSVSYDEGETWTKPHQVSGALNGERHKAVLDPISGRYLISFRDILLDSNDDMHIDNDWVPGNWTGWVGTWDDLILGREGYYRVVLGQEYSGKGDCGYAGAIVQPDGTFVLDSYGIWRSDDKNTYVMSVSLKLEEFDKMAEE